MCGICGFSGPRAVDKTKLRWLLAENQSRGSDSTGVYGNHLYKDNIMAKVFIQGYGFDKAVQGARTVIGHTRLGTCGAKTKENSHPFIYSSGDDDKWGVVGAHNGFIIDQVLAYMTKELGFEKPFEVDSQIIFAAINKTQSFDIISQIEGAMALGFMMPNHDPECLYLYKRGPTRSLHIGEANDGLYYSSEANPLHYIGCRDVREVESDVLITIKNGVVIDRYVMPDTKLKSLPADVKRYDWRDKVPDAEVDALPEGVNIPKRITAGGPYKNGNWNNGQGWGSNYSKEYHEGGSQARLGFQHENYGPSNKEKIAKKYAGAGVTKPSASNPDDTVHARFYFLINTIRAELESLNVTLLPAPKTKVHKHDDLATCILTVFLKTQDARRAPLMGWSIIADDKESDVACITSLNGCGLMKIPMKFCEKPMDFMVYDPVLGVGPFKFTLKPQAARVVEVTLEVPFQQGREEKTYVPNPFTTTDDTEGCGGDRSNECSLHDDERYNSRWAASSEEENSTPLPEKGVERRGGLKKGKLLGGETSASRLQPEETIPESDEPIPGNIDATAPKLIPNMPDNLERNKLIGYLTASTNGVDYEHPDVVHQGIIEDLLKSVYYESWYTIYKEVFSFVKARTLLRDACRLQGHDRQIHGTWYKIHFYIETLIKYAGLAYVEKSTMVNMNELLPSTIINRLSLADGSGVEHLIGGKFKKKKSKVMNLAQGHSRWAGLIPKVHFELWLKWLNFPKEAFKDMKAIPLSEFQNSLTVLSDEMNTKIKEINETLENAEFTTSDALPLKESLIKHRRWIVDQKASVDECVQNVELRLATRQYAVEDVTD